MTLLEKIEKLSDSFATKNHPKETEVIVELGQIAEGVKELEEIVTINTGIEETVFNLEMLNIGLHWRAGDKPICDKCGGEVMLTDCANICDKCEQERIRKDKIDVKADDYFPLSSNYHWEENKQKKYIVLGFKECPVDPNDYGMINEADNPMIYNNLEYAKEVLEAVNKVAKEQDWGSGRIVELKELY